MAVFLDRVGNLSNEHGPVVDALTVLGQLIFADVEDFVVTTAVGVKAQCLTSTNPLPVVPSEAVSYSVVHQLRDGPVATDLINVSISDPDDTDSQYDVCFRMLDGNDLPSGTYTTSWWIAATIGSGIFASGTHVGTAAQLREAYKHQ